MATPMPKKTADHNVFPILHLFVHGDVVNAQTWEVSPHKDFSRAFDSHLSQEIRTDERFLGDKNMPFSTV